MVKVAISDKNQISQDMNRINFVEVDRNGAEYAESSFDEQARQHEWPNIKPLMSSYSMKGSY